MYSNPFSRCMIEVQLRPTANNPQQPGGNITRPISQIFARPQVVSRWIVSFFCARGFLTPAVPRGPDLIRWHFVVVVPSPCITGVYWVPWSYCTQRKNDIRFRKLMFSSLFRGYLRWMMGLVTRCSNTSKCFDVPRAVRFCPASGL